MRFSFGQVLFGVRLAALEVFGFVDGCSAIRGKDFVLRSLLGPLINQAKEALMQLREPSRIFGGNAW